MRVRTSIVLEDCIDKGIELGWNRAYKHVDNPSPDDIKFHIERSISESVSEYFNFDDELPI